MKFVIGTTIAAFGAVALTNITLLVFSENLEAGAGGGDTNDFMLACGLANVSAVNLSKGTNGLASISVSMNGQKTFETSSSLNYDGYSSIKLANVRYSFSNFDLFVDVVISTESKKLILDGYKGQVVPE